ncbi:hypothetical protein ACF8PU_05040 [Pseudomonas sp. GLN_6]|uniref:hypothetical protein n=1 Tax=Pseudomonas sp. GLN_6 TaxID=3367183 RepID=UPI00370CBAB3
MKNMLLYDFVFKKFSSGIQYQEAVDLCLALYCSADWVPEVDPKDVNRKNIAKVFSLLAKGGYIKPDPFRGELQGDHLITEQEYWDNVISTLFSSDAGYNSDNVKKLLGENS